MIFGDNLFSSLIIYPSSPMLFSPSPSQRLKWNPNWSKMSNQPGDQLLMCPAPLYIIPMCFYIYCMGIKVLNMPRVPHIVSLGDVSPLIRRSHVFFCYTEGQSVNDSWLFQFGIDALYSPSNPAFCSQICRIAFVWSFYCLFPHFAYKLGIDLPVTHQIRSLSTSVFNVLQYFCSEATSNYSRLLSIPLFGFVCDTKQKVLFTAFWNWP